jgi:alkanesulfonate monooxygenase SsuD/methylene tetrahydromethanopterin reductase-like flavin-dependent oxidoreductase (luciferase family)
LGEIHVPQPKPAICIIATPKRRRAAVEVAQEAERRGFAGIYTPSPFGNMSFCEALAWNTKTIPFATAIAPIYQRTVEDFAQSAAFMHEISGGRFSLGIGIAHGPSYVRMGVTPGKPLGDTRAFIEKFRAQDRFGELPPIIVATLRQKMIALAGERAQGLIFANACLRHTPASLSVLSPEQRTDGKFFIGNMIPTCISDDIEAAKAVNRRTLTGYANLPNYRNYWKEAGYREEMEAIERCIAESRPDDIPKHLHDRWLADCTLFGTPTQVRDGVEAWRAAGVHTPVIVASSASGNQMKALEEVFATFNG